MPEPDVTHCKCMKVKKIGKYVLDPDGSSPCKIPNRWNNEIVPGLARCGILIDFALTMLGTALTARQK